MPNVISRPLLEPYRYKHTSRQGFPSTRHACEQVVLQHNEDERQLTFRVPSCLALGSGGDLWESLVKERLCAATDRSISTLKSPNCSLSFSYLPSGAKKSFKLAFTPPPFFWKYLLSLSFLPSTSFFLFYSSVPRLPHRKHKYLPVFIHQNSMAIFLLLFFFCQRKVSEYCSP